MPWPILPSMPEPCGCRHCRKGRACAPRAAMLRRAAEQGQQLLDDVAAQLNLEQADTPLRQCLEAVLAVHADRSR
jgi:hypothetical protein